MREREGGGGRGVHERERGREFGPVEIEVKGGRGREMEDSPVVQRR